jgi:hypothetical protein
MYLDNQSSGGFMNLTTQYAFVMQDGFLIELKIIRSLEKAQVLEDDFDDRHEIFDLYNREKKIEEVKMLSEAREPLLDLDKCSVE